MKLHSVVQNEAILSNVGEVGEFRIRNSAKAFNILSSGLYANKIRAIIRELSCNAVDSHVAAGNTSTPFDIHLPNSLEPYFSIRDYGTGLSHEQVKNIYTTYFESTKTNSNEFIGALGLGSKSPFSYTDNFTVTAVQNNRKGIYTAFINEQGVPSIALMMEEQTTDPAGVEVRFAVEDRYDFDKFATEARHVYEYFKLRPVVTGCGNFKFVDPQYKEKDIIPGVHYIDGSYSYAIMGNIKYRIEVPNAPQNLGDLAAVLACGLVMEFDIGELDFQASREGLSYIPETIASIKNKLTKLNAQLAVHVKQEAEKFINLWERADYLHKKTNDKLFKAAVFKYVADTKFPLFDTTGNRWSLLKTFKLDLAALASKYNIAIRAFSKARSQITCTTLQPGSDYRTPPQPLEHHWTISPSLDSFFVITDTPVGAFERAKYHWRHSKIDRYSSTVYVLSPAVKNQPMLTDLFFKEIMSPPKANILKASELLQRQSNRAGHNQNVTIMALVESRRAYGRQTEMVWNDAGKSDTFDSNTTYYYLPLSGYQSLGVVSNVKGLHTHIQESGAFPEVRRIYGVRKSDIEWVKKQKNWVDLDKHIICKLSKLNQSDAMGMVKRAIDWKSLYQYNAHTFIVDPKSPYLELYNTFKDVATYNEDAQRSLSKLHEWYQVSNKKVDPTKLTDQYRTEVKNIKERYPLLTLITRTYGVDKMIAEYINLIDKTKGV